MAVEKSCKKDEIDVLDNLNRLTVDPEWNKSDVDNCNPTPLNVLWSGGKAAPKGGAVVRRDGSQTKKLKAKSSITEKVRVEPYSLDCLQSLQRLCLSQEKCEKLQCPCKRKRLEEPPPSSKSELNIVYAAAQQRRIIQNARFSTHRTVRLPRTVVQAARLKLKQSSPERTAQTAAGKSDSGTSTKPTTSSPLFVSKSPVSDFASLACSSAPGKNSSGEGEVSWTSPGFQQYRSGAVPCHSCPRRLEQNGKPDQELCKQSKGTALHTASCSASGSSVLEEAVPPAGKRQCTENLRQRTSCSQEARLDDLSVNELASYFEDLIHIPKKMSSMAEMMYA